MTIQQKPLVTLEEVSYMSDSEDLVSRCEMIFMRRAYRAQFSFVPITWQKKMARQ